MKGSVFLLEVVSKLMLIFQVVMFNLEVGEAPNKNNEKKEEVNPNKLEDMIKELGTTLITVKHEQEYMQVMYKINCCHLHATLLNNKPQ